jgi:hypothetical protein
MMRRLYFQILVPGIVALVLVLGWAAWQGWPFLRCWSGTTPECREIARLRENRALDAVEQDIRR